MHAAAHLAQRYASVLCAAWVSRAALAPTPREPLERQFLPAALEIIDTPAPALAHGLVWTIVIALAATLLWGWLGQVDMVAVAPGKIISAGKAKLIQPAETAVVKRLLVRDGQAVQAGEVLIELEAAATATGAEAARLQDGLTAAQLESARFDALARSAAGTQSPVLAKPRDAPRLLVSAEERAMHTQYQEHRAHLAALDAEVTKRRAELQSARELASKLRQTAPIARRRADDYRGLVDQHFMSQHGYLEKEQARIEQERDLAYQEAKVAELEAGIVEAATRKHSQIAEFERGAVGSKTEADKKAAQLAQELVKARTRETQQVLRSPVDGTVQQLAVNTIGGVVTPAQALMVIAPNDYAAEVEAVLENKDVGFVKVGQKVEVKVDTFPFTRYGTLRGTVSFVSHDAVNDEKKGPAFQARVKLDTAVLRVEAREVGMTAGMAVSAEIATGTRRLISYFLDPLRTTINESVRER